MSVNVSDLFGQNEPAVAKQPQRRSTKLVEEKPDSNWFNHVLLLGFIGLLVWGAWLLSQPGTLPIQHVRIAGDFRHLQPEQLQTLVTNEVRGGFFNVNVSTIRDVLIEDPWVRGVIVQRVWPDTLRVVVSEQVPVIRWGEHSLLNDAGERFTPEAATVPEHLPMLKGPDGSEAILLQRFSMMNERLQSVGLGLSQLEQDSRRSWRFIVDAGFAVVLGRKQVQPRFERFISTVPQALAGQLDKVDYIDMRYTNGFAVGWKNSG